MDSAIPARVTLGADAVVLAALAVLAGFLDLVDLAISGFGNTYYAAAAQAGSQSWSAMFFGAVDASGFITLDKPPLATWLMSLSIRLLGLHPLAVLLPQALLGVGTVLVLYLAVRRSFGRLAAAIAGVVMALTPVAVLIFRYDNPDALLTFLLVCAAWALGKGIESGRLAWGIGAASLVGAAFLTKYLQADLVLPGFALAWLVCAPGDLRRRIRGLVACGIALVVASGWWLAIVSLVPASSRPYVGGTASNSVLELVFGYDGLARLLPGGLGSALGAWLGGASADQATRAGTDFGGPPGLLRLFDTRFAGQIAWFLPAALVALGAAVARAVAVARRVPGAVAAASADRRSSVDRRSPAVAGYLVWGGWLLVHAAVLSFMTGIIHAYYSVAMAPAVAALVGALAAETWSRRRSIWARAVGFAGVALTGLTAAVILATTPRFLPGLGLVIAAVATIAGLVLLAGRERLGPRVLRVALVAVIAALLAGPVAYSATTIARAHADGDVAAGPRGDGSPGVPGGATPGPDLLAFLQEHRGTERWIVAVRDSPNAAEIQLRTQQPVMMIGGFNGGDPWPTLPDLQRTVAAGELRYVLVGGPFDGHLERWVRSTCVATAIPALPGSNSEPGYALYDCGGG